MIKVGGCGLPEAVIVLAALVAIVWFGNPKSQMGCIGDLAIVLGVVVALFVVSEIRRRRKKQLTQ